VVEDVARELRKLSTDRNVEIITEHADNTPTVNADPTLVSKAVYHLVINAIKYTPDGGTVTITTQPTKMENDIPGVEITVEDSGIGLDAEHHELIFEKFYQVGNVALHSSGKTTFKGGGPGLGLAIVRGVARTHNGRVWVESAGHDEVHYPGSTFHLQLPVHPPKA